MSGFAGGVHIGVHQEKPFHLPDKLTSGNPTGSLEVSRDCQGNVAGGITAF